MSIQSDLGKIIVKCDNDNPIPVFETDWYNGQWGKRKSGNENIKNLLNYIGLGRGPILGSDGIILGIRKVAMKYEINLNGEIIKILQLYILNENELVENIDIAKIETEILRKCAQQVDAPEPATMISSALQNPIGRPGDL